MTSFRTRPVVGLLVAAFVFSPFLAAQEAPAPKLPDEEVVAQLQPGELAEWKKAIAARMAILRDLQRAKELTTPPREILKGAAAEREVAEKKERGDKLAAEATARGVELEKTFERLRASAAARMKSGALSLLCPVQTLPDALRTAASEITAVSGKVGYDRLYLAGVFLPSGGRTVSDPGLGASLREALTGAGGKVAEESPAFVKGALNAPAGAGVVLAEVHPVPDKTGAVVSVRLVDAASFRIVGASLAFVSSGVQPQNSYYGAPDKYEVVFTDRRNFLGALGVAQTWSFGVEGDAGAASMLKSVLSTRPDIVVNGYALLAGALGGTEPDTVSKAMWMVSPAGKNNEFEVKSRAVGNTAGAPVAVGSIVLRPYVKPAQ